MLSIEMTNLQFRLCCGFCSGGYLAPLQNVPSSEKPAVRG